MMQAFIKHSYRCGTEEDKKLSQFIVKNWIKGVAITNAFLLMFYLSRFRTYRNSYLGMMHVPATLFGLYNGVKGTSSVFYAYLFD